MAYAANQFHQQEPFTMYPNRYTDVIKPRLTDAEKAVCDTIIRLSRGWHKSTARISNSKFCAITGKSEPAIIRAKKSLEEKGLIVILEAGGGASASLYALDLYYDDPVRSIRASMQCQEQLKEQLTETHADLDDTTDSDVTTDATYPQDMTTQDVTRDVEVNLVTDQSLCDDVSRTGAATPIGDVVTGVLEMMAAASALKNKSTITGNDPDNSETTIKPDQHTSVPNISDPAVAPEPVATEAPAEPTPNAALAPGQDPGSIIYINKQTLDNNTKSTNAKPEDNGGGAGRKAVATVRYEFLRVFPESEQADDYPFFGWTVKEYGVEACLYKLRLLREYRKLHPIENPYGLFRTSLVKDYQPSRFIREKLLADEKARRVLDRSQQESQRWDEHIQNFDYSAAQTALKKLLDTLN